MIFKGGELVHQKLLELTTMQNSSRQRAWHDSTSSKASWLLCIKLSPPRQREYLYLICARHPRILRAPIHSRKHK